MNSGLDSFRIEALNAQGLLLELYGLVLKEDPVRLDGSVPLIDEAGDIIDRYEISIVPSDDYPNSFPYVYETAGRLPNNIDWHVYPDGHFCIKAIPEEKLACINGISLISFIKDQVLPYLFNQNFREKFGYFLRERSHGTEGNLEFFKDTFKTNDLLKIRDYLIFILKRRKPNRVELCFCGSGIKYRKCHRDAYQVLSPLSDATIATYIEIIDSYE
jgi:hypothetical protein